MPLCLSCKDRNGRFFKEVFFPLAKIIACGYRGYSYLHSAVLRSPARHLFVLPGNSGSGKTTISRILLRVGWCCLSDDSVLIKRISSGFILLPFKRTIKIPDNKKIDKIFIRSHRRIIILFPEIKRKKKSSVSDISPVEAMELLMRCSAHMLTIPQLARKQMGMLSHLLKRAECYRIELARDMLRDKRVLLSEIESVNKVI